MVNIKHTFMVSALSIGLVVGAVGLAGAATSTNYLQKNASGVNPNPVVMNNAGSTKGSTTSNDATAAPVNTPLATNNSAYSINPAQALQSSPQQNVSQQPVPSQPTSPQVVPTVPRSNMTNNNNYMAKQQSQNMHNNGSNGNGMSGNMGHMGR